MKMFVSIFAAIFISSCGWYLTIAFSMFDWYWPLLIPEWGPPDRLLFLIFFSGTIAVFSYMIHEALK